MFCYLRILRKLKVELKKRDEERFRPLSPVSCPKTQSYKHFSEHFIQSGIFDA